MKQREEHLAHQQSCRCLYDAWCEESKGNPSEILCIIHDKMDTAKIVLLQMRVTTKATQGLGQLPMNITSMVSHGYRDGAYAHCCLHNLFAKRFQCHNIIFSKVVPSIGRPLNLEVWSTIRVPVSKLFVQGVVEGESRCLDLLQHIEGMDFQGPKPFPKKLYLQLDNSAKDNKNKYLMAFLSLLTTQDVFEEIHANFLLVGHTHEDIDAYFSHL